MGRLHKTIREEQDRQIQKLFGVPRKAPAHRQKSPGRKAPKAKTRANSRDPALAPYGDGGTKELRATYKKQTLTANVQPDGTIVFNGKSYNSPSAAGAAAVNRPTCNGWTFWEYEDTPGNWVKLTALRA